MLDKYKPKNLNDWATVLVLGGAAAVAFGILKKAKFESETELDVNVGDYKFGSELEFEVGLRKGGRGGKKRHK